MCNQKATITAFVCNQRQYTPYAYSRQKHACLSPTAFVAVRHPLTNQFCLMRKTRLHRDVGVTEHLKIQSRYNLRSVPPGKLEAADARCYPSDALANLGISASRKHLQLAGELDDLNPHAFHPRASSSASKSKKPILDPKVKKYPRHLRIFLGAGREGCTG